MTDKKSIVGFTILIFALYFSIFIRQTDFNEGVGVRNLEAPYHVLLTVTALNDGVLKNNWLLPTVSLGKQQDKNIPWGATRPTESGDYIYTSFTSPGFLLPYAAFKAFDLNPTIRNLAYLNSIIGCIGVGLLYLAITSLLRLNGLSGWTLVGGGLLGSSIGVFSNEALTSQGLVYWSQSLYQLIFIGSIYSLIALLKETLHNPRTCELAVSPV